MFEFFLTDGDLGECSDEDGQVLLAKEFGCAPHSVEDWPHVWRCRTEKVLGARQKAIEKRRKE